MTREVVGPLSTISFRDGTRQAYTVPRNTMDPRYPLCANHHPACDCREAELAENLAEYRGMLKSAEEAAKDILAGHATWAYEQAPDGTDRLVGCMCTGCQIVRRSYLLDHRHGDSLSRDEVYGLSDAELEAGFHWAICTEALRGRHPDVCRTARTRLRKHYHEHVMHGDAPVVPIDFDEVPF